MGSSEYDSERRPVGVKVGLGSDLSVCVCVGMNAWTWVWSFGFEMLAHSDFKWVQDLQNCCKSKVKRIVLEMQSSKKNFFIFVLLG